MEQFIQKLDTLLDNDPFSDLDGNFLSNNDLEVRKNSTFLFHRKTFSSFLKTKKLLEKYRVKYLEDRQRIRNERQTKSVSGLFDLDER